MGEAVWRHQLKVNTVMVIISINRAQGEVRIARTGTGAGARRGFPVPHDRHGTRGRMPEAQGTRTRSTRQAAAILAVLSAAPCFSSAREVHDTVRRHIEGIRISTVYRHLRMLTEHGSVDIVRGPGGEVRYRLRHGVLIDHASAAPSSWRRDGTEAQFPAPAQTLAGLDLGPGWETETCQ